MPVRLDEILRLPPRGTLRVENPRCLAPLNRALLVTDGTLTDVVEAWFLEAVSLDRVEQRRRPVRPTEDLPGDEVFERWITMRGVRSHRLRFAAQSLVAAAFVSRAFLRDLEEGRLRLGDILRRRAPGTIRYIDCAGVRRGLPRGMAGSAGVEAWIERHYRVVHRGRTIVLVREFLPERGRVLSTAAKGS